MSLFLDLTTWVTMILIAALALSVVLGLMPLLGDLLLHGVERLRALTLPRRTAR